MFRAEPHHKKNDLNFSGFFRVSFSAEKINMDKLLFSQTESK